MFPWEFHFRLYQKMSVFMKNISLSFPQSVNINRYFRIANLQKRWLKSLYNKMYIIQRIILKKTGLRGKGLSLKKKLSSSSEWLPEAKKFSERDLDLTQQVTYPFKQRAQDLKLSYSISSTQDQSNKLLTKIELKKRFLKVSRTPNNQ